MDVAVDEEPRTKPIITHPCLKAEELIKVIVVAVAWLARSALWLLLFMLRASI